MNNQFEQLLDYVRQHREHGTPESEIRATLKQHNWNDEIVDQAFAALDNNSSPTAFQTPETDNSASSYVAQPTQPTQVSAAQTYLLFPAIGDAIRVVQNNFKAFLIGALISVLFVVAAGIVIIALVLIFGLVSILSFSRGGVQEFNSGMAGVFIAIFIASLLLGALLKAFMLNMWAFIANDSIEHRQSDMKQVISLSTKNLVRTTLANILLSAAYIIPILLGLVLLILAITMRSQTLIILFSIIALIGWWWGVVYTYFNFTLVPIVAIFEQERPLMGLFARSQHLLVHGGKLFLLKALLLLIGVSILNNVLLESLRGQDASTLPVALAIISWVFAMGIDIISSVTLILLYRNRRAVRG